MLLVLWVATVFRRWLHNSCGFAQAQASQPATADNSATADPEAAAAKLMKITGNTTESSHTAGSNLVLLMLTTLLKVLLKPMWILLSVWFARHI